MPDAHITEEYMKRGDEFRETVVKYMAEGNVHMANTKEYMQKCEKEREDHDSRIAAMETAHSNYKAVAASWIAAIPVISGLVSWWVSKNTGA